MSKTISSNLLTDIQSDVTTLATLVEIKRTDDTIYRITNHDEDITFESKVYDHSIPFNLSAISSTSTLSVDNTELELHLDETVFLRNDFINGAFTHAEVTIKIIDYKELTHGSMTVRTGWIGEVSLNEQNSALITVAGLLKILDFERGRVYQPSCDADLGDNRCKIAINFDRAYSSINKYHMGEWVYNFSGFTSGTLSNPGFEAGDTGLGAITGWVRSTPDNTMQVVNGALPIGESDPPFPVPDGTYWLWGGEALSGESSSGREQYMYNDVDVTTAGLSTTDIDNDKIFVQALADAVQIVDTDTFKFQLDLLDTNGEVLKTVDTGFITPRIKDDWETYALSLKLPSGTRTIRFYAYVKLVNGNRFNVGIDNYRLRWWDETVTTPWNDIVYKASRIIAFDSKTLQTMTNNSFEADGDVSNTNTDGSISGWTFPASTDYWQVVDTFTGLADIHGDRFLMGGDDSSGTQSTYNLEQTETLTNWGADTTRIDLGKYMLRFKVFKGHGDTTSLWGYDLEFLSDADVILGTASESLATAAVGWSTHTKDSAVPLNTRKVRIRLKAQSPVGSSAANVAFDGVEFYLLDAERPDSNDPIYGEGSANTTFNTTIGGFTIDNNVIWKTVGAFVKTDVVATVTDKKTFTGTNIAGANGVYETGSIEWLSGNNVGRKNIIRTWETSTKEIKMYYNSVNDIQVGDRFLYVTPCRKRFDEDCVLTFDNAINFRGFPHLPGKITKT